MNSRVRSALRTGVPFGVAMGMFYYLQHHTIGALAGGLVAGLLFGMVMARNATRDQTRGEKRLSTLGITAPYTGPIQVRTLSLALSAEQALTKAQLSLAGLRKIHPDTVIVNGNTIVASTGMTWQSFGEKISIEVQSNAAGSFVRVSSEPKIKFTTGDSGKGVENVEIFTKALLA